MSDLTGKRALVTGAARGIGFGVAKALASRGAEIVATDVHERELERLSQEVAASGGSLTTIAGDLAKAEAVREIACRCGNIDILVNCAAVTLAKLCSIIDEEDADWALEFAVNVDAPIRFIKALAPKMIARKWGRVINISSIAATRPNPLHVGYSASKAALEAASKAIAIDLAPHGIRVNVVALGYTNTESFQRSSLLDGGLSADDFGWQAVPIGRVGSVEEVASLCCYLASDAADSINGTVITVDGGLTAGQFTRRVRNRSLEGSIPGD